MAGGFTNYTEGKLLGLLLGSTAYSIPATLYAGLLTDSNTPAQRDAGTVTEVTGNAYARVAITNNTTNWPAPTGTAPTQVANGTAITFPTPTPSGWGTVHAAGLWDASTSGNLLVWADLAGTDHVFTGATSDTCTSPAHGLADTTLVRVSSVVGSALPTGLTDGTAYFIRDSATDTFKLALTSGGTAIDLTAAGVGNVAADNSQTLGAAAAVAFAIGALILTLE